MLSKVFRGTFLALLKRAFQQQRHDTSGSLHHVGSATFLSLLDTLYKKDWVVYCKKPFKTPNHVVQYLSRYTHKTAIYNNRLMAMDEETVTFQYRDYKDDNKVKLMKLHAMEFMRRFMLHVLPSGFQRIRYYGFLSNCNRKTKLRKCMHLTRTPIKPKLKLTAKELILKVTGKDISVCSCGGHWQQLLTLHPNSS